MRAHSGIILPLLIAILLPALQPVCVQADDYPGDRLSLDRNWRLELGDAHSSEYDYFLYGKNFQPFAKSGRMVGVTAVDYDDSDWRAVNLPHDWALELDFDNEKSLASHGFKPVNWKFPETSVGWYRRLIDIPEDDRGKRLFIKFDGVFRDCEVWLNGFYLGNNLGGYMEFMYDVTDMIYYGKTNALVVRVDASMYEGWWYEGAGIYRHTWLIKKSPTHIPEHGTCITTRSNDDSSVVTVRTDVVNDDLAAKNCRLNLEILDDTGRITAVAHDTLTLKAHEQKTVTMKIPVSRPRLWSLEQPHLYQLVSTLHAGEQLRDRTKTTFGIRTVRFDPDKGFFLNGKSVKIKGACVHQDHAGVGVAVPDRIQAYRIERLKEMGCNAYRSAHHPPTPELLDACDRLGMLVMDETRLLNGSPEYLDQFRRLILRDRNHPSVIIWCLGNEEMNIQNKETGKRIVQTFKKLQRELDPSRLCTYGGNNGNQYEGVNEVVDVRGFNYMRLGDIDKYHQEHPEQPLWGSEEASTLCTRGQYRVDDEKGYMSDYDKEENTPFPWCMNAEAWWKFYSERDFLAGGFIWTGFDYRGEPSPYRWPCVNSHFGVMDTCGFPKNNYYYYQAWWTDKDVLHIYPHWNWPGKIGEPINVWCQSNCDTVELFLNGRSLGSRNVEKNSHVEWDVIYVPGVLEARGLKNGKTLVNKIETTGPAARLRIAPDRGTIHADGEDVSVINITALDIQDREVPDADNFLTFKIEGPGNIIGVGNGNPSSHEPDKILTGNYHRKLFNGKCQVIVQSTDEPGTIRFTAVADQLQTAEVEIDTIPAEIRPYVK